MPGVARSTGVSTLVTPYTFFGIGGLVGTYCVYALATTFAGAFVGIDEWVLEVLLLGVPAVGHTYLGYWLRTGSFSDEEVWRIGFTATAGAVIGVATTVLFLSAVVGASITPASGLFLLVGTGTEGALVGVVLTVVWTRELTFRPGGHRGETAVHEWDESAERVDDGTEQDEPTEAPESQLRTLHSLVRHNVRNRLNVIDGHLDLLVRGTEDVDDDHFDTIEAQKDAVLSLLSDVEVAVEAVTDDQGYEPVPLASVVRDEGEIVENTYDDVTVTVDVPTAIRVRANDLLSAVIENVLTNAVEHHDEGSVSIEVVAERDDDVVELRIADDGPGIPDPLKGEVLEPEVGDGTGMGLFLVDTLVREYGGTVEIGGHEPRGTVVTITLPRASVDSDHTDEPLKMVL
jgi:signal transduction histidine kinase